MDEFNECLDRIQELYLYRAARIKYLEKENEKMRDEHYRDAAVAAMKRELDSSKEALKRGFPLTEEQSEKILAWQKKHETEVHKNKEGYHGAADSCYTYMFYPTSLGCLIKCRCHTCHMEALNTGAIGYRMFEPANYNQYMRDHNAVIDIDDF